MVRDEREKNTKGRGRKHDLRPGRSNKGWVGSYRLIINT